MIDLVKAICFDFFLIAVGITGYIVYFVDNNIRALTWGIACSVVFVLSNILFLCVFVNTKKAKSNINRH